MANHACDDGDLNHKRSRQRGCAFRAKGGAAPSSLNLGPERGKLDVSGAIQVARAVRVASDAVMGSAAIRLRPRCSVTALLSASPYGRGMTRTGAHVRPWQRWAWPPAARTSGALIATVGLTLLTAACGGSHSSLSGGGSRSSSSGGGSPYEQARAFAECVRSHGVPLWPEPQSSGRFDKSKLTPQQLGAGSSQIAAAERACKSLLPTYVATGQQSHFVAQALRFSRCMRGHGATNFPDPQSNGAIVIPHAMENSPAYLAALNFCVHKYGVPPPPS